MLLQRALRDRIFLERKAMHEALVGAQLHPNSPKHETHAEDVVRQGKLNIAATEALLDRFNPRPKETREQLVARIYNEPDRRRNK